MFTPLPVSLLNFAIADQALKDRIVVITGSTGGLGTQLCIQCAKAGATLVLVGRNVKKLEALYDVLDNIEGAEQPAIMPINQELATEVDYENLTQILHNEFSRIDTLVHLAADIGVQTPLQQLSQKDWSRVMSVNLTSTRLLTAACLPLLQKSAHASVIFTLDEKLSAYWGAYGVSKHALHALLGMFVDETDNQLADDNAPLIAFNGIDPGPMRTPLRRKAFPGELENESPLPTERMGPFLALIQRQERMLNNQRWQQR